MAEANRLAALRRYEILDTPPEPAFDRIVELAARMFDAPMATISLLDANRMWVKARIGFDVASVPRKWNLYEQAIVDRRVLVIRDLAGEPRYAQHPYLKVAGIRFYASAPLHTTDGHGLGAVTVVDTKARPDLPEDRVAGLQALARLVETELDRRLLARQLARSADRFRDLAEMSSDWLWESDAEHRITQVSCDRPWLSGIATTSIGRRRWEYEHARPARGTWDDFRATMEAWREFSGFEYRVDLPSGAYHAFRINGRPRFDERGSFVGYIGTGADLTAQRQAEARLARAEAGLRQRQKLEALGQLTGGIAHDFNNLLAAVMGNIECALDAAPPDASARPFLTEALDACERGADLVARLLTFARRRPMAPEDVALGPLLDSLAGPMRGIVPRRVRLSVAAADDLAPCRIDRDGLLHVILDLAINARDAMPEGGLLGIAARNRRIDASEARGDPALKAGDWIELSVSDTGAGMPPEVQTRLFEPFFSTKEPAAGAGLGLAMAHGFVHQSGGFLTFDTTPGRGTCVRLYLPAGC
jgi:signal transduction histidine kinase